MELPTFLKEIRIAVTKGGGLLVESQSNSLPVNMTCQEADLWCWAAVTQAVENFRGFAVTQTEVATDHVSRSQPTVTCDLKDPVDGVAQCGPTCQGSCNSPHILSIILNERGRLASPARQVTPRFQDVVAAIDAGKPLPVRIKIHGGGGHFICVVGYSDDGTGNQFVDVLDPLVPGRGQGAASLRSIDFSLFVGGNYTINGEQGTPNFIYDVRL